MWSAPGLPGFSPGDCLIWLPDATPIRVRIRRFQPAKSHTRIVADGRHGTQLRSDTISDPTAFENDGAEAVRPCLRTPQLRHPVACGHAGLSVHEHGGESDHQPRRLGRGRSQLLTTHRGRSVKMSAILRNDLARIWRSSSPVTRSSTNETASWLKNSSPDPTTLRWLLAPEASLTLVGNELSSPSATPSTVTVRLLNAPSSVNCSCNMGRHSTGLRCGSGHRRGPRSEEAVPCHGTSTLMPLSSLADRWRPSRLRNERWSPSGAVQCRAASDPQRAVAGLPIFVARDVEAALAAPIIP